MSVIGKYFIFLGTLFGKGEKLSVYWRRLMEECVGIGVSSIFIVAIVSTFIGAVSCIQTAYNLVSPIIPISTVALTTRESMLLEFCPTIVSLILAGKIGSNIASEIGAMRITEQIDALEVMGINSSSYLVLPKVVAAMLTFPMLVIFSAFLGILGGYLAGTLTGVITERDYLYGIRDLVVPYNIFFMCVKPFVFGFLIASISSFKGFFTSGGALEVGKASTQAVTNSCISILIADYLLAQLLL